MAGTQDQQTDRFTGGLTANWRPAGWLVAHATVGIDHGSQTSRQTAPPVVLLVSYNEPDQGYNGVNNLTTDIYSADLRATATATLGRQLRAVSSMGMQLVDTRQTGIAAIAMGLSSTNLTLNGAVNPTVSQLVNRAATLGGYGKSSSHITIDSS